VGSESWSRKLLNVNAHTHTQCDAKHHNTFAEGNQFTSSQDALMAKFGENPSIHTTDVVATTYSMDTWTDTYTQRWTNDINITHNSSETA